MERIDELKARLEQLRPLDSDRIRTLWPRFEAEKPQFVQSTNAIEGNRLTVGETIVVLQEGVTIGGKSVKEHLEVINSGRAFDIMLSMAKEERPITRNTLLTIHEIIVSGEPHAGTFREQAVHIYGSDHAPPNWIKVSGLIDEMFETYENDIATRHPVVAGAKLHFNLLTIHPFVDGNGRTARLINNLHLVKSGFPPVLIDAVNDKPQYFDVLKKAQMKGEPGKGDPADFILFMIDLERRALERYVKVLDISYANDDSQPPRGSK